MTDINQLSPWPLLKAHHQKLAATPLTGLFTQDVARFDKLSLRLPGMLVDYSKNQITEETVSLLVSLARAAGLEKRRDAKFAGERINVTENRAVLHTALRADGKTKIEFDGNDVVPAVHDVLKRMGAFSEAVRSGAWKGHTGKEITDIVNVGIGGSSLGPQLACEALAADHHPRLRAHYVANVEASDLAATLARINPETTLFIVASKTFTTAETMQNAHIARDWLVAHYKGDASAVAKHFVAASTNVDGVAAFGIDAGNMFPFQDWVGGRYSVWSSIGLSVMLLIGAEKFGQFLAGARSMDEHFKSAPLEKNLPVLMALIGLWHRNMCNYPAIAVIPYHAALRRLPAFLQQLDMESNGKRVMQDGKTVPVATGPIIFGEPGTDAQHSFFQWLHQSPDVVPVDFIVSVNPTAGSAAQQNMLLANCLAQSAALMHGQNNTAEPHRHFPGNRPSTTFMLDELSPFTLGMLLSMYEHKVFVQGVLWCVNSFDQWGVELGKVLAKGLEPEISGAAASASGRDASTAGLVAHVRSFAND